MNKSIKTQNKNYSKSQKVEIQLNKKSWIKKNI